MRKGGGGVDELRSAIMTNLATCFRGFSWSVFKESKMESLIGRIRGVRFRI